MDRQLGLFGDTIGQQFRAFHAANPAVYDWLRANALALKRRGRERYSMKTLLEVLRWHHDVETDSTDFKLNNNFTAYYARLLMQEEPELDGFFELREIRSE